MRREVSESTFAFSLEEPTKIPIALGFAPYAQCDLDLPSSLGERWSHDCSIGGIEEANLPNELSRKRGIEKVGRGRGRSSTDSRTASGSQDA